MPGGDWDKVLGTLNWATRLFGLLEQLQSYGARAWDCPLQ